MTFDDLTQYNILADIDLSPWFDEIGQQRMIWLEKIVRSVHKEIYENNQRIVFRFPGGDRYATENSKTGMFIQEFQFVLNSVDISNFFVILVTPDTTLKTAYDEHYKLISSDPIPITILLSGDPITKKTVRTKKYDYASVDPLRLDVTDISERKRFLLTESKTFCMYPWIHIHAYPNGQAYPCCMSDMRYSVGNTRKDSLESIWNQDRMREIRQSMLNDSEVLACTRCYEQEASGFF